MELTEVTSSTVRSIGYDKLTEDLVVEFNRGIKYAYHKVPKELFEELLTTDSKGKFINSAIKNKFAFEKLEG